MRSESQRISHAVLKGLGVISHGRSKYLKQIEAVTWRQIAGDR